MASDSSLAEVVRIITAAEYVRTRLEPRPGDAIYLHLADLRLMLDALATAAPLRVLDFGCGGSPYRSLFPNATYFRADVPGIPDLDYVIEINGKINAPNGQFDLVLSTQVLEHVLDPANYVAECFRLLAPGGRLFLSTHGFYEEHGCPHDYYRWTSNGLRAAVEAAGFRSEAVFKLTTNGRAVLQLLEQQHGSMVASRWHPFGIWLWVLRWLPANGLAALHRWSDRFHGNHRVVPAEKGGHPFFLGVAIHAVKPLSSPCV
jgi:SAM-dependent methyltransferase